MIMEKSADARMLHEVAQITAQSFQSSQEAMRVALEAISHFLDSRTLFIARFEIEDPEPANDTGSSRNRLKIIAARNTAMPSPTAGAENALDNTYCQTIFRTQQPLIVDDSQQQPFYQQLETTETYHIGSYMGVPLIYSDGRVYGTLCSQDPGPRPLSKEPEKLELLQIMARFLISHIEKEELIAQVCAAEQAQAELARKEQQARAEADQSLHELQAIFEAIGDGLLVSDTHGQLQMNAAARCLLSMEDAEDNVQSLAEIQSKKALIRDESGQPLAVEQWPIMRGLSGEQLVGTNVVNIQRVNPLGELRYHNVSGMPIYDQQGQINGAVCVFRDVTEHYLLEQRTQDALDALLTMAESLAWLPKDAPGFFSSPISEPTPFLQFADKQLGQLISTLLQSHDMGIVSIDPENATLKLQISGDQERACKCPLWLEAQRIFATSQDLDADHLRNNEIVTHVLQPQPGAENPLLVEAPMFLGNRLLGILAVIYHQHDPMLACSEEALAKAVAKLTGLIYERERLLQEQAETRAQALALQETNRRFNEFLSIASHELKGPLTTTKGNIQLAQRALRTLLSQQVREDAESSLLFAKMQRYLGRAEQQTRMQDRLTSDLIDVSRIRAGKLELHMQQNDIGQIVRDAVEDQRQITEERVINLELPTEPMVVYGDGDRLGQVVSNYLTNALKYSSSDKPVGVTVTTDGATVCVTVSDQGAGLTPDEQQRVWERFYRAKNVQVLSGNGIGLGLGLHICKTIAEQHGGNVGLSSTPGKGSSFWFTLPLSRKNASSQDNREKSYV